MNPQTVQTIYPPSTQFIKFYFPPWCFLPKVSLPKDIYIPMEKPVTAGGKFGHFLPRGVSS